jgi:hypothetical protein
VGLKPHANPEKQKPDFNNFLSCALTKTADFLEPYLNENSRLLMKLADFSASSSFQRRASAYSEGGFGGIYFGM